MKMNLVYVPRAEGRIWHVLGEQITCKVSGVQTQGAFSVIEEITQPNGGPPLHVHHREDELFCIIEGNYEITCGERTFLAEPGAVALLPRDIPHSFRNIGDAAGTMLVTIIPAGFEGFFERISRGSIDGWPDMPTLLGIAHEFGLEFIPK